MIHYPQRQLLYLKKFLKEREGNEFEGYALDTVGLLEERISSKLNKQYLGLLCRPVDTYQIYGYLTNTNIAILAIIKNVNIKESEIKHMLYALHSEYISWVTNPFSVLEQPIKSTEFSYRVQMVGNKYTTQMLQMNTLSNATTTSRQTKSKTKK